MNDERERIARQYVHDMIRSFVAEGQSKGLLMTSVYAPDIDRLLEIACCYDNYATKHKGDAGDCGAVPVEQHPGGALNPFCTNDYYDIDGHCVHSLNGTVTIIFNGVSIQEEEYAERMKLIEQYREERRKREEARQKGALIQPK